MVPHDLKDVEDARDRKLVFVVYGRNRRAQGAVVQFLLALGLKALNFYTISAEIGGAPFIGDIVREGIRRAQAIVVLFTPDEMAELAWYLRDDHDEGVDVRRRQSRPNVIFEAGMALGLAPTRTILVTLGSDVALFSDIGGIHILHLSNVPEARSDLRRRLVHAGCSVDEDADFFSKETAGDFDAWQPTTTESYKHDVFLSVPMAAYETDVEYQASWTQVKKVFDCLKDVCSYRVFWAGENILGMKDFDINGVSTRVDIAAIEASRFFMMIYPKRLPTSVLFEAGHAFACGKPSAYFATRRDLPFLVRDITSTFPQRATLYDENDWKTFDDIVRVVARYKGGIFPSGG
jgi:hypothetical protein